MGVGGVVINHAWPRASLGEGGWYIKNETPGPHVGTVPLSRPLAVAASDTRQRRPCAIAGMHIDAHAGRGDWLD